MPLSAAQQRRYARHICLTEIGANGQDALLAQRVSLPESAHPKAGEIALEYLTRAGVKSGAGGLELVRVGLGDVQELATASSLECAAAHLAGALAAVEAIKHTLQIGVPITDVPALDGSS